MYVLVWCYNIVIIRERRQEDVVAVWDPGLLGPILGFAIDLCGPGLSYLISLLIILQTLVDSIFPSSCVWVVSREVGLWLQLGPQETRRGFRCTQALKIKLLFSIKHLFKGILKMEGEIVPCGGNHFRKAMTSCPLNVNGARMMRWWLPLTDRLLAAQGAHSPAPARGRMHGFTWYTNHPWMEPFTTPVLLILCGGREVNAVPSSSGSQRRVMWGNGLSLEVFSSVLQSHDCKAVFGNGRSHWWLGSWGIQNISTVVFLLLCLFCLLKQ